MLDTTWQTLMHTRPEERPALGTARHGNGAHHALEPDAIARAIETVAATGPSIHGTVWVHPSFPSAFLSARRDVWVYLPPGYDHAAAMRYPVLYMHDGDNLFSAATAFNGQEWGLDETAEWLIRTGELPPVIIVGVAASEARMDEYTWVRDEDGDGGAGRHYARFLVEELKPFIDQVYHTHPEPRFTGVMGASLGGLISLYLGRYRHRVFGRIGAMSPSIWWADRQALADLAQMPAGLRIWLDMGSEEGEDDEESEDLLEDARDLVKLLAARGYEDGRDLCYVEGLGQGHNEAAWGERVVMALQYLYSWESVQACRHWALV